MAAPKGNEYWKIRSKSGREKQYTAQTLLKKSNEYFIWCQENPLKEEHIVNRPWTEDKDGEKITHPYSIALLSKMRPFTIHGLCNFAEICVKTFDNYSKNKDKDFLQVTTRIRQIIYNQKFEGAASGFLNPNIIARDLGLVDKKDVESGGKPIKHNQSIDLSNVSPEDLEVIARITGIKKED